MLKRAKMFINYPPPPPPPKKKINEKKIVHFYDDPKIYQQFYHTPPPPPPNKKKNQKKSENPQNIVIQNFEPQSEPTYIWKYQSAPPHLGILCTKLHIPSPLFIMDTRKQVAYFCKIVKAYSLLRQEQSSGTERY